MNEFEVRIELLADDGTFPNNERLPALIYRNAIELGPEDPAASIEHMFRQNGWRGMWRDGIHGYHHYHSTAQEVLGIAKGTVRVQLGGEEGVEVDLAPGDVVVIPAGVAHKNLGSSSDLLVVGAYPRGKEYDMNYGRAGERPDADRNIAHTPLPETDPVFGARGPLVERWRG